MFFTVIITPDLLIILNDSQNFLIHLLSRYVGINATEINHSAGRYHPGQSPPLEAGLEVRVKKRGWLMFAKYGKRDGLPILNYSPEVGMSGNSYFHCHMKKHLLLFLRLETCLVWVVIHL